MTDIRSDISATRSPGNAITIAFFIALVFQLCILMYCLIAGPVSGLNESVVRSLHILTVFLLVGFVLSRWFDRNASFRTSQEETAQMAAMMSLFSTVKHQLNNDMQVVVGNAELAQILVDTNGCLRKPIRNITLAATDAIERIEQLSVFSTTGTNGLKPVDLNATLRECMAKLASEVPPIVTLRLDLETVRTRVIADRYLLALSLSHLIRQTATTLPHGGELIVKTCDVAHAEGEMPSSVRVEIYIIRALSHSCASQNSMASDIASNAELQTSLALTRALVERCGAAVVDISVTAQESVVSMMFSSEREKLTRQKQFSLQHLFG